MLYLQDYFVLLPLDYYEGTILTENITRLCNIDDFEDHICIHYDYPSIDQFEYIYGSAGYHEVDDDRKSLDLFDDEYVSILFIKNIKIQV